MVLEKLPTTKLAHFLKKQYFKSGDWSDAGVLLTFVGIVLLVSLPIALALYVTVNIIMLPLGGPGDGIVSIITFVPILLGVAYAGVVWWEASGYVGERKKVLSLRRQPNPQNALEAIRFLNSEDGGTRVAAANTLGEGLESEGTAEGIVGKSEYSPEEVTSLLVDLFRKRAENSYQGIAAASVILSKSYPNAVIQYEGDITELLNVRNPYVITRALVTIGNLGCCFDEKEEEYIELASGFIDHEEPSVRIGAATALYHMPTEESVELLEQMTKDNDPEVEETARRYLQNILEHPQETSSRGRATNKSSQAGEGGSDANILGEREPSTGSESHFLQPPPDEDFSDVGGMYEVKEKLAQKVIEPVLNPAEYDEYGISGVTGVLLYGPPGTGKTYISKALAGELNARMRYQNNQPVNYARLEPSQISGGVSVDAVEVVDVLFEEARAHQPTLVFIDEIDAIASERGEGSTKSQDQVVNQFLDELTKLNERDDMVIVVGATNQPEKLDDAVTRSGRMDIKIEMAEPSEEDRESILRTLLNKKPVAENMDYVELAKETEGLRASDLKTIVNDAAHLAKRDDSKIEHPHLIKAIEEKKGEGGDVLSTSEYLEPVPDLDFSDVGGMDDLKKELTTEVIEAIERPEEYEEYGLDPINGVLLYGPPGTGKTYMSRAFAGELDYSYAEVDAGEVLSKWINESVENLKKIFESVRASEPCVLFIDEIDAIASEREPTNMHQDQRNLVNQLLTELDKTNKGDARVIVIAATNNIEKVDEAIKRKGRFDKKVEIPPPDKEAIKEIFKVHLRDRPTAGEDDLGDKSEKNKADTGIDLELVAKKSVGMVGSDLEAVVNGAARKAMQEKKPITTEHLIYSIHEQMD